MRIGIIGAGALGLYYGALLQRSGQDVHFLLRRDHEVLVSRGLQVNSITGNFHLPRIKGYRTASEIGPVDLVLVGLKTFSNRHLAELVRPLLGPQTAILTLQNGLGNEELLADAFGTERVLGGTAFLCSNRGEPGTVNHLGEGKIRLGEVSGGLSKRAEELAELFLQAGVSCTAVSDLRRIRWEKLVWNIPFNGLCALLGLDTSELLACAAGRDLAEQIMLEVIAGANAQSLEEPIDETSFAANMLVATNAMDHYRPSMLIDRLEARPLELDAIYRIPLQAAAKQGIPMPRAATLYQLLSCGETSPD